MKYILTILIMLLILSCEDSKIKNIDNDTNNLDLPDQVSYNVTIVFADSSYNKAKIYSDKVRIYSKKNLTFFDGNLKVEFFSKYNGKRLSILTADSGRIDDNTKDMFSWGNVKVVADSSMTTLETSELNWKQNTEKIYSTKPIKIQSSTETIQGSGFESDQSLKNYIIYKSSGEKR